MNKKGFTLVELLAVIVILAVIAVISVPMIFRIIETAREEAAKSSALGYIDAVEKYMIISSLDPNNHYQLENGHRYYVISDSRIDELAFNFIPGVQAESLPENVFLNDILNIKGEYPLDGYVQIGTNNNVEEAKLIINGYIIECLGYECQSKGKYKFVEVDIEDIVIKNENLELVELQSLQLDVEVLPKNATQKKLTYTSSDDTIATVDSTGKVVAEKAGNVTITVSSINGIEKKVDLVIKEKPLFYSYGENPLPIEGYDNNNTTRVLAGGYTLGIDERLIGRKINTNNYYFADAYSWVTVYAYDQDGKMIEAIGSYKLGFTTDPIPENTKYLYIHVDTNAFLMDIYY